MPEFKRRARLGKCDVCGETTDVVVACSPLGAYSNAYCRNCYDLGIEPYNSIVSTIMCIGGWPDDVAVPVQHIVRNSLNFFGKTETELIEDVNNAEREMYKFFEAYCGQESETVEFEF